MYDLAILGGGPAGLSAAMTARARSLNTIVLYHPGESDYLEKADDIPNYPGMPHVSGKDMLCTMREQAVALGVELRSVFVQSILPMGDSFSVSIGSDFVEAKKVILCLGAKKPKLLPGEEALIGRGVSYCGTCDGMFYRGKRVAVIAQTKESEEEGNFLASLAETVDYFGKRTPQLAQKITVHDEKVTEIMGDSRVTGVKTSSGEIIDVDGVFIFRDAVALGTLLPGLNFSGAFVDVDRTMRTNIAGVYAAGDITGKPLQIAKAVGEGCIAALSAAEDSK